MEERAASESPVEYCSNCSEKCARKPRTKLAGVKTTLFNPYLPSFKKILHDTMLDKLSDEHCRTTLPEGVETLASDKQYNYDSPSSFIPKFGMMNLTELEMDEVDHQRDEHIRKTLEDAYKNTNGSFLMPTGRLIQIPNVKRISYLNFRVRMLTPEPAEAWRAHVHEKGLLFPYGGGRQLVESKYEGNETEFTQNNKCGEKTEPEVAARKQLTNGEIPIAS